MSKAGKYDKLSPDICFGNDVTPPAVDSLNYLTMILSTKSEIICLIIKHLFVQIQVKTCKILPVTSAPQIVLSSVIS